MDVLAPVVQDGVVGAALGAAMDVIFDGIAPSPGKPAAPELRTVALMAVKAMSQTFAGTLALTRISAAMYGSGAPADPTNGFLMLIAFFGASPSLRSDFAFLTAALKDYIRAGVLPHSVTSSRPAQRSDAAGMNDGSLGEDD